LKKSEHNARYRAKKQALPAEPVPAPTDASPLPPLFLDYLQMLARLVEGRCVRRDEVLAALNQKRGQRGIDLALLMRYISSQHIHAPP
jgi:hypothetical protein